MKISYVIPAFNTEKYIGQCIESVLNQKHHEQIIIINDCSTDGTLNVIKSFKDKSITVIDHSENKGCCYSRLEGLKLCTGDYMTFIDSDDYYLKQLPDIEMFQTDIIDFALFGKFSSTSELDKICSKSKKLDGDKIWDMYCDGKISQILVNKLFSKRIYNQVSNNMIVDNFSNYCDNIYFMSLFAFYAKSYQCIDDIFYFYRYGTGMTTYLSPVEKMRQYCDQKNIIPYLKKLEIKTDLLEKQMMQRAFAQYRWINNMLKFSEENNLSIKITSEDVLESCKLFFSTFLKEYEKYGVELTK